MQDNFCSSYASVLFDLALKDDLDHYYESVRKVTEVIDSDESKVYDFICNLNISKEDRKSGFAEMLQKEVNEKIIYFVWTVIDFDRARSIAKILKMFLKRCADYKNIGFVKVSTVHPLTDKQIEVLKHSIEKKLQKEIILENRIQQNLIGGMRIETDTWSFDNSFKTKLENIRNKTTNIQRKEK